VKSDDPEELEFTPTLRQNHMRHW